MRTPICHKTDTNASPAAIHVVAAPQLPLFEPDWQRIEADIRTGISAREIGRREGISHTTVSKRAAAGGWVATEVATVATEVATVATPIDREPVKAAIGAGIEIGRYAGFRMPGWPDPDTDFDWNDDGNIAVPSQNAIAIYETVGREIAIREQAGALDSEDTTIRVNIKNVDAIISKLQQVAAQIRGGA
jgi:hypothetical protein